MKLFFKKSETALILFAWSLLTSCNDSSSAGLSVAQQDTVPANAIKKADSLLVATVPTSLDTVEYSRRMIKLANGDSGKRWPAKNTVFPLPGAIFPYKRIVAYYGNLYSKNMGILGELPKDAMLAKLKLECNKWQAADSGMTVVPALHYIAATAQGQGGKDGKYRFRMPSHQIDTIMNWAREINGLVFLDIQVGHSSVRAEVPVLEKYLLLPDVHLGIDPEFSMKGGEVPGKKIGTFDASDINDAIDYLANIVRKNNLPPKVLVIHRFTQGMITNYQLIKKTPEVQLVIDMDGWGSKILKKSTWLRYIYREPVEFTGFKLFYKNDTKTDRNGLYSPEELVRFIPSPVYIQYQ